MFTLLEEFLLLSIHESRGTFIKSTQDQMKPGLAGAILAELALSGKIQTSNNHRLHVVDDSPTESEVLSEALHMLKEPGKERKFGYWINFLSQKSDKVRKQTIEGLIKKGCITQDDDRLLWVIPSPLMKEIKASTKYWVVNRLRAAVLTQEGTQQRDVALLSLVKACGLLDFVFLRDERKAAEQAIYAILINQALKDPVIQTIQEIENALNVIIDED